MNTLNLTKYDKIRYIKNNIDKLNHADLIDFAKIVYEFDGQSNMNDTAEGLVINLKNLNETVIDRLYGFIQYRNIF